MDDNKATINEIIEQVERIVYELTQLSPAPPFDLSSASPDVVARITQFNE